MNQLHKSQLRRVFVAFLLGVTLFISTVLGQLGYVLPAQAATSTPEMRAYQNDVQSRASAEQAKAEVEGEGGVIDNIREKLNLDEPIPEGTKLFLQQIQGEDVEVDEPHPSGKSGHPDSDI